MIQQMSAYIGAQTGDATFKMICDTYNNALPIEVKRWGTRNLRMVYSDWCATAVSAAAITTGLDVIVPIEMGVYEMIQIATRFGIYQPTGNGYGPQPGDVICYQWLANGKYHTGIIADLDAETYTTIEGNATGGVCQLRRVLKSDPNICGVISPLYCTIAKEEPPKEYYQATTDLYLRTGPSIIYPKCKIELYDGRGIRNYLYKGEVVEVIGQKNGWAETNIVGRYTWNPWCSMRYLKKV